MSIATLPSPTPYTPRADLEPASSRARLASVDVLRGAIMIIMALDHTRDFVSNVQFPPELLAQSTLPLFLTRWITHFCAPTFVFLAGLGPSLGRPRSTRETSWLFLTRGLWLVVFELTVMAFALSFDITAMPIFALTLWAIGWSMVVMSALVYLPRPAIAAIGFAIVAGHNLFDGITPQSLGAFAPAWTVLHVPGMLIPGVLLDGYPLLGWTGVMALGYACGAVYKWDAARRQRFLIRAGLTATLAFIVLRAFHLYGDPVPWTTQRDLGMTFASFLNARKQPASLQYVLMTLGPMLVALALLERARGKFADRIAVFGRVPFFYYATHFYLIHIVAIGLALLQGGTASFFFGPLGEHPDWFGLPLVGVYAVWVCIVLVLYLPCRWFSRLKARRNDWWLSYL